MNVCLLWAEFSWRKEDKPPSPQVFNITISCIPVRAGIPKVILQPWSCLLALYILLCSLNLLIKNRPQLAPFFSCNERQPSTDGPVPVKKKKTYDQMCSDWSILGVKKLLFVIAGHPPWVPFCSQNWEEDIITMRSKKIFLGWKKLPLTRCGEKLQSDAFFSSTFFNNNKFNNTLSHVSTFLVNGIVIRQAFSFSRINFLSLLTVLSGHAALKDVLSQLWPHGL